MSNIWYKYLITQSTWKNIDHFIVLVWLVVIYRFSKALEHQFDRIYIHIDTNTIYILRRHHIYIPYIYTNTIIIWLILLQQVGILHEIYGWHNQIGFSIIAYIHISIELPRHLFFCKVLQMASNSCPDMLEKGALKVFCLAKTANFLDSWNLERDRRVTLLPAFKSIP